MTAAGRLLAESGLSRLEGRSLLAAVLGVPIETLIARPEQPVDAAAARRFFDLAARRVAGEPLAYLLGEKEFYGRRIAVSPDVLVPRPETETLVQLALARLPPHTPARVLDLGTGSGCVAITLALERPAAQVLAVDRSAAALSVAAANAQRLGAVVEFRRSDWFADVAGRFALIVGNPPYVAAADPHLPVLRHEPQEALVAGDDGLDDLRRIIGAAPAHLLAGGWLILEHGHDQAAAVRALYTQAGFADIETVPDLAGVPRVGVGRSAA